MRLLRTVVGGEGDEAVEGEVGGDVDLTVVGLVAARPAASVDHEHRRPQRRGLAAQTAAAEGSQPGARQGLRGVPGPSIRSRATIRGDIGQQARRGPLPSDR